MTERQMDILYYLHAQDDFVPVSDISSGLAGICENHKK